MRQLVVFSIASEGYGLPITQVQEIIRYTRPRSVPGAAAAVSGVINLRSKIIPVCDLSGFLGHAAIDSDEGEPDVSGDIRPDARKIVIVETRHGSVGLVVDEVDKVMNVEDSDMEETRAADAVYVEGIAKVGEELLVLLSADALYEVFGLADLDEEPLAA